VVQHAELRIDTTQAWGVALAARTTKAVVAGDLPGARNLLALAPTRSPGEAAAGAAWCGGIAPLVTTAVGSGDLSTATALLGTPPPAGGCVEIWDASRAAVRDRALRAVRREDLDLARGWASLMRRDPGAPEAAEPVEAEIADVAERLAEREARAEAGADEGMGPAPVVLFSPTGERVDHPLVAREAAPGQPGAILLCGRYEGLDQRFIDTHVDQHWSLGDFVLSGGEIAALAVLDAVARLQPGVLGDAGSHQEDSFNPALDGLLDCPHYTRPEVWEGQSVPPELLSGHHVRIERWRREQRLAATARQRPELIAGARAQGRLAKADEDFLLRLAASRPG
jgi:tRNA (guanine37-N1)-methyltransferase